MAVTLPYNQQNTEGGPPGVTNPPWFVRKTLLAGETMTINWLITTEWIWICSSRDAQICVNAAGVANDAFIEVPGGLPFDGFVQTTRLLITNDSANPSNVSVLATLSTGTGFPELAEANGFDGGESHCSVAVA